MSEYLQKRKKVNTFWLWWNIIEAIVVLAAGILAIVAGINNNNNNENIDNVLGYAISCFVVLDGIFRVVMYFVRYDKQSESSPLIIAGFEVALGGLLVYIQAKYHGLLIEALVAFISIALMTMGLLFLVFAIYNLTKRRDKLVMPIAVIVLAAILIGVGVALMVLQNTGNYQYAITMIMTGSTLAIVGLSLLIMSVVGAAKDRKQIKKDEQEEQGNYALAEEPEGKKARKGKKGDVVATHDDNIQEAEIIEPNEAEDPKAIEGPRAIENKEE